MRRIKWSEIKQGDQFKDGAKVVGIHETIIDDCYAITNRIPLTLKSFVKGKYDPIKVHSLISKKNLGQTTDVTILSSEHLLLCDIGKMSKDMKRIVLETFGGFKIPTVWKKHVYYENDEDMAKDIPIVEEQVKSGEHYSALKYKNAVEESLELVKSDPAKVDDNHYWLPAAFIHDAVNKFHEKILCNGKPLDSLYVGKLEAFCVETDTHKYEANGLIHHNSVLLQNIIFHALTHGYDMKLALVDLKQTEFTEYRPYKNVAMVATSTKETRELLLIARNAMNKCNKFLASTGLKDMMDYKHDESKFTGEVVVAGRRLKVDDKVEIRLVSGEVKTVTVAELEQYLEIGEED